MPFSRLAFILICVISAAAATVYIAQSLAQRGDLPATGLIVLTIIALCASFGWRVIADRKAKKDDDTQ
jgi:hypothetical protein